MKKLLIVMCLTVSVLLLIGVEMVGAASAWYDFRFTGADIWTYSPDNALQSRTDQTAPRRYRDWTLEPNEVQATTYGLNGGLPGTGFNAWAPGSGFAFDLINLWGAGGTGAAAWGEKYVSVGTPHPDHGLSSWKVIQSPATWTSGIVVGGDPWSADETHAFPVWRSAGTSDMLGLTNMNDPSFVYEFQVLISNPESAFEPDGKLRVFFGGFSDDKQMTGPDNYEVSGVMELTPVPEPATMLLLGSGLIGLAGIRRRFKR